MRLVQPKANQLTRRQWRCSCGTAVGVLTLSRAPPHQKQHPKVGFHRVCCADRLSGNCLFVKCPQAVQRKQHTPAVPGQHLPPTNSEVITVLLQGPGGCLSLAAMLYMGCSSCTFAACCVLLQASADVGLVRTAALSFHIQSRLLSV